jgi:hypothetical protein
VRWYNDFVTYVASLFFGFLLLHICVQNAINSTDACFAANTQDAIMILGIATNVDSLQIFFCDDANVVGHASKFVDFL